MLRGSPLAMARAMPAHGAVMASSGPNPVALLGEARIFVDWSDAANNSGRFARNANDAHTPTANLIAFPTGPIVNESGGATPARTNYYTGAVDPGGTNNATRLLSSGANQVLYLHRTSLSGALPAGTYTLKFRARSAPGTGSWAISFGSSAAYTAGTVHDLDWTNPTNDGATTFTATFTNPANDIAIRLTTSGSDVLVDRIQLYEGASVPAWSAEAPAGGRRAFAYSGSLPLTAANNVDTTGLTSGMLVFDPVFPAKRSYTGYTVLHVGSIDAATPATQHIVNVHPNEGGTTTGNVLQVDGTAPYAGEINSSVGSSSRAAHAFNIAGDGFFIAGHGRDAAKRQVWTDSIPASTDSGVFSATDISRWTVGGFNTSNVADLRANLAPGDYAYTVIWDRLLSNAEFALAANELRARLVARGVSMAAFTDFHVISGDSNAQRAAGGWSQLVTADGYFSPARNLMMANTSVGGQGIDSIEATRFDDLDAPALLYGCDNGRYALYHLCIGTNDWDLLNADGTTAYVARVQALIGDALAVHSRVHVLWYSLLPQNTASAGRENWEAQRAAVNSAMAAWIGSQPRVHLCDVGGAATIGNPANFATYYQGDQIHLNGAGDTEFAAVVKPAVEAWRALVLA